MTGADPLWTVFPRWIEVSGLPEEVTQKHGSEGWLLLRKLIEMDCERNLTSGEVPYYNENIAHLTGVSESKIEALLSALDQNGWIEWNRLDSKSGNCHIVTPLRVPKSEAEIRSALHTGGITSSNYILRYFHDLSLLNTMEKIVYLYQMIFGLRFTPKIVEELEEISNTYDIAVIYDVFSEAHRSKAKSLAWIRSRLQKRCAGDEER